MKSLYKFFKTETILCVAFLLAIISSFFVHPDSKYLNYIDYRTISLLFSLMAVMAGFQSQGVFLKLGKFLLSKAGSMRQILLILVLLCFFGSMIITNDVVLIVFVPFSFVVLDLLGKQKRNLWIVSVVCMQTIAANLGSMFTPIGNPQNLFLYSKSGLSLFGFLRLMFPYTAVALFLLILWILILCRNHSYESYKKISIEINNSDESNSKRNIVYIILFILCLLTVAHILPYQVLLCVVLTALLCFDKNVLLRIDYSLLLTFVVLFIFIGNLGRVSVFSQWLCEMLNGKEVFVSVMASQVISNVPAALLLSGFTKHITDLIVGTNLGGLGTLIASMASLISFRHIASREGDKKAKYLIQFTVSNVIFLVALLCVWLIVR